MAVAVAGYCNHLGAAAGTRYHFVAGMLYYGYLDSRYKDVTVRVVNMVLVAVVDSLLDFVKGPAGMFVAGPEFEGNRAEDEKAYLNNSHGTLVEVLVVVVAAGS